MSQKTSPASASGGIDLDRLCGILIDHKWIIIASTLVTTFIGASYALLAPPVYRADALVQIESSRTANPLDEVTSLLGKQPPSQSEIEIIRSRGVLGRAVDILGLTLIVEPVRLPLIGDFFVRRGMLRPDFFAGSHYVWAEESINVSTLTVDAHYLGKKFELVVLDPTSYALYLEKEHLGYGRVGEASEFREGAINLAVEEVSAPSGTKFRLQSQHRSVAIAELKSNLSIVEQGRDTRILYWSLLDTDPEFAETGLQTIADIYVSQNVQRQSEEARATLRFLNEQVPLVQTELGKAEERLNSYRAGRESVNLSLETQSVLQRLVNIEAQLNELEFSEAEISRRFMPSHPTYEALLEKKEQLRKQKSGIENKIEALPETQQEVLRLERDISVSQQIYVQLRNKVQEMQIAEASTAGNVHILDNASVYPRPVSPDKKLLLLLSTLAGLVLSSGLVLLRDQFRNGIETQAELEKFGLDVLTNIPRSLQQARMQRKSTSVSALAVNHAQDPAAEALRVLRAAVAKRLSTASNRCIAVTSPEQGDGKTFVVVNLAVLFAQLGKRVLVVDSDMHQGSVHRVFRESAEPGLSEFLTDGRILADVIRPVAGIPNLFYLGCGSTPANPGELLAGQRFAELLSAASGNFDLVLLDTAAVLQRADACVIGTQAGINMLVTRFRDTTPQKIGLAMHRMNIAGAVLSCAVLNAQEDTWAVAHSSSYRNSVNDAKFVE